MLIKCSTFAQENKNVIFFNNINKNNNKNNI